ncbi:MAG: SH3 domain-containing protein, partial [Deltaproteobacteria bacterium]|nr:SH3 domain-containing protein [Deltaproteobacteria bacterium]
WHPREWARNLFGVPYRVAVLGLILALAGVVLQGVLSPPAFLTAKNPKRVESLSEGEAQGGEPWKYVNVSSLNVRELPNEGARAVGILYRNQRVLVERTEGDWAQVSKPERGFVSQRYLQDSPAE